MTYEKDILNVLLEAGECGLSKRKIAHHVFNIHNGFFTTVTYEYIYKVVSSYIAKNCKNNNSLLESTGKKGFYRINKNSERNRQLMLDFRDEEGQIISDNQKDTSLSLF